MSDEESTEERLTGSARSSGAGTLGISNVSTRHYFASEHLWSARHNASLCRIRETELQKTTVTIDIKHRSYATTAVLTSVAFLEALVNETYADAADPRHDSTRIGVLLPETRASMTEFRLGKPNKRRPSTLEKYDHLVELVGSEPLNRGARPYQDVELLTKLRNALIHFTPDWSDTEKQAQFEEKLRSKFRASTLLGHSNGSPWFPIKALGAGCAEWAYTSAKTFADAWTDRVGIIPTYATDLTAFDLTP